jgi:hypothetical protein
MVWSEEETYRCAQRCKTKRAGVGQINHVDTSLGCGAELAGADPTVVLA